MPAPGWTYDPRAHNYRLNGRFVKFDRIIEMAYAYAEASGNVVAGLGSQVAAGALRVDHWQTLMRQSVKNQYINQYVMGRGGLGQMTQRDWGIIGRQLRDQYQFLDGFAKDVASGRLSEGQIRARAQMYIDAAHEAFERARCEAFGMPALPAYPGDGQTQCLTRCKCNWLIEEVYQDGALVGWNATWRLNPAEHCADCPVNAEIWNPLFVPAGMTRAEAAAWREAEIEKMLAARGMTAADVALGGPGSGHWGHKGRPGKVGGSAPGGGRVQNKAGYLSAKRKAIEARSPRKLLEGAISKARPDLDEAGVQLLSDVMTLSREHYDTYAGKMGLSLPAALKDQVFGGAKADEREMVRLRWELEEEAAWKDANGRHFINMVGTDAFEARPLVGNSIADAQAKLAEYGVTLDTGGADAADVHRQISDLLGVAAEHSAVGGLLRGVKAIRYVDPEAGPHQTATADYQATTRTIRVFKGNTPPRASTWVHELGHALEQYARDVPQIFGEGRTASLYANQNFSEDFAETFTARVAGYDMADWLGPKWAAVEDAIGRIP